MKHTIVWCVLLVACGGGEKKAETTPVANQAPKADEPREPTKPADKIGAVVAGYKDYVTAYCACVGLPIDKAEACTMAATDKYVKEYAPKADEKPVPEEIVRFVKETEAATKQFTECATKLAAAAAGSAATP